MDLDRTYCGDAAELLTHLPNDLVNLTLTRPPYEHLRTYKGFGFSFELVASELYRVTADGGVLVWIVGDALLNGNESGESFRQALSFKDIGFKLHDTMIFCKQNPIPRKQNRYVQQFEYMFVLVKGDLKTFNPIKEFCTYAGVKSTGKFFEKPDAQVTYRKSAKQHKRIAPEKIKGNVWTYRVGGRKKNSDLPVVHPAVMNLQLAKDHIISWTNEGDIVLDPFVGSGTTLVAAKETNRQYVGFDVSQEYLDIATLRLDFSFSRKKENVPQELGDIFE